MLKITQNQSIRIELIRGIGEREYYSDLLTRHHYLGSSAVNRNTIIHVARVGRKDVAILTWEPQVVHWFKLRDELVGWTAEQKTKRLKHCVQNRRFLMLSSGKNLASQVLSLSLKRLEKDSDRVFGFDFLLAETFVDPEQGNEGTCYKAAGWSEVGLTQGGRGRQERSRKLYFVKELKKDALAKLRAPKMSLSDTSNPRQKVLFLERLNLCSLRAKLEAVPNYLKTNGNNPLAGMLALITAAVLSGETHSKGIFRWINSLSRELRMTVGCYNNISYTTVWRILTNVDHQAFTNQLCSWLKEHAKKIHVADNLKVISLDGKCLKGASRARGVELHVLSLIDAATQIIHTQIPIEKDKEHEIPAAQDALRSTDLDANTVVVADALHTQRKTAEIIVKKNANYLFAVKGNQGNLEKAIKDETPTDAWSEPYTTEELGHGRIETRTVTVASLEHKELDFYGSRSIALITRTFVNKKTGKLMSKETTPYISSFLNPAPEKIAEIARLHWSIENGLHYKKDNLYQEDKQTMRTGNGPLNMSILRSFAIGFSNLAGFKYLPEAVSCFARKTSEILTGLKCNHRFAQI